MPNYIPDDLQAQQEEILRRQKYAEMLQQQGMEGMPQGQMRGDVYVPPSWTQQLAQAIKGPMGAYAQREATNQQRALADQIAQRKQDWLGQMPQASQSQEMFAQPDGTQMGPPKIVQKDPTSQDYLNWLMKGMQVDPQMAQSGMWMADKIENRQQRMQELQMRLQDQRLTAQERMAMQKQLAEMNIQGRQDLARITSAIAQQGKQYFTPVQTAQGVMSFNARTGQMEPVQVNGQAVIGAQADPTLQGNIAGAKEAGQAKAKRAINMAGLGDTLDRAESLLSGSSGKPLPTGSTLGTIADTAAGWVGASPSGAKEAQELKAIGGALTSKMPRMEGPQSDKDAQLYREMAAVVGDSTIPRDRRLAALGQVRGLWEKYADVQAPTRRATDKSGSVIDFSSLPP